MSERLTDAEFAELERTMRIELESISDDGLTNAEYADEVRSAERWLSVLAELREHRDREPAVRELMGAAVDAAISVQDDPSHEHHAVKIYAALADPRLAAVREGE